MAWEYGNFLEFGTPGFAFIYWDENVKGKKPFPRSLFGHLVGMVSDTALIQVYIPQTKSIKNVRRTDFRKYDGTPLPGVEALLDGIARQVEIEATSSDDNAAKLDEYSAHLTNAFVKNHSLLANCNATKKKKFDPNVPRLFSEACQFPGWRAAIDREYTALVKRNTWVYIKRKPEMKPVPYTWVFKAEKPLDRDLPLTIDPSGVHVREHGGGTYQCGGHTEIDPAVDFDDFTMDHGFWESHVWPILATRIPQFEAIKVQSEWAGHYAMNTFDQNAIMGPHPELANFVFLNGFSGHGLQQSPAMGRGTAEWLTYGEYRALDMSPFRYDRITEGKPIIEGAII